MNPRPADYKSAALPTELHQQSRRAAEKPAGPEADAPDTAIFPPACFHTIPAGNILAKRAGFVNNYFSYF